MPLGVMLKKVARRPAKNAALVWDGTAPDWQAITGAVLSGFTAGLLVFGATDRSLTTDATLSYSGGVLAATSFSASGTSTFAGRAAFGGGSYSADLTSIIVNRAIAITPNDHGVRDESTVTVGSGAGGYASYDALVTFAGAATYDHLHAFQARQLYNGSGSLTDLVGLWSTPGHTGAGTVTNAKGAWIKDASGAGTITNNYGIYVDALTRGGTLNYAIFTAGTTPSQFGGAVTITGALTANSTLTATANIRSTTGLFEGPAQGGFVTNAYFSGGWKYRGAGAATRFVHNTASAVVSAAAVGVTDGAITWLDGVEVVESSGAVAIGLYGTTPTVKYATNGFTGGFVAGAGTAVLNDSTFTGSTGSTAYTIADIVRCLKKLGAMAA